MIKEQWVEGEIGGVTSLEELAAMTKLSLQDIAAGVPGAFAESMEICRRAREARAGREADLLYIKAIEASLTRARPSPATAQATDRIPPKAAEDTPDSPSFCLGGDSDFLVLAAAPLLPTPKDRIARATRRAAKKPTP